MKNNKIITLVISLITILLSIFLLFGSKKDFSINENRYLQSKPKFTIKRLLNGKFISEYESYLTDHFPLRDTFVSIKTITEKALGKKEINDVYIGKNGYLMEKYKEPKNNDRIINKLNNIYNELNYLNMNIIYAPTSISIYSKLLPDETHIPLNHQIDNINILANRVKIDAVNFYPDLYKNCDKYKLYYKLDHHWTIYGAYYAYHNYIEENNMVPLNIEDFDIKEVSNSFKGTLYSKVNDYTMKPDSIYAIDIKNDLTVKYMDTNITTDTLYNEDYLTKKDKYSYFLDNNHSLIEITNNNINTKKELVIIKDSYANSLVPFLVNHYKKIYVIDPRYYKESIITYIKNNKSITDLLFLYNMNGIDSDVGLMSIR